MKCTVSSFVFQWFSRERSLMQVYIQQTTSNFLYSATRGWVKTVLEADAFPTTVAALNHCLKQKLPNVHIRVHAPTGAEFDTIFSVSEFPNRTKVPVMTM